MSDKIISVDDIILSPRGRKVELDTDLVNVFKKLKAHQAVVLEDSFGKVPMKNRSSVSAKIRRHWLAARDEAVRIDYSPDGIPQVRVRDKEATRTFRPQD